MDPRKLSSRFDGTTVALVGVTAVLVYASARTLWPFITAIVLGAWSAHLLRPVFRRVDAALHGRQRAAALMTALLLLIVLTPVVLTVTTLVPAARSLFDQLRGSGNSRGALEALVQNGGAPTDPRNIMQLVREHGASASKAIGLIAGASVQAIVGVFVFFVVFFAALVNGGKLFSWLEKNAPLDTSAFRRLSDAFFQAGRGLLVGNGLTAVAQGAVTTIAYFALGVPRALLLGFLSTIGALIPLTGPTIVWVPVAAGLALTGHPVKAAVLAGVGVFAVGTIDNILRPYFAKRAHVGLDTSIVLVSIFGGIAVFGGWGLLLGPLVVRLAAEALSILRERGVLTASV